jgi:hypothetical protein
MKKIISFVFFAVLLSSILVDAQNLGMNCAEDCQNKLKNCKASCTQIIINKRSYNKCLDNCDDMWRECRKKCK